MTVYYIEESPTKKGHMYVVLDDTYDVFNLDTFEREMNEIHEWWSYSAEDAMALVISLNK